MNLTTYWNRIPPLFCVMIARNKGRPVPIKTIAASSGMSVARARWIYMQDSWDAVPIGEVERFAAACGVTTQTFRLQLKYLKRSLKRDCPFPHLQELRPSVLKTMTERVRKALA